MIKKTLVFIFIYLSLLFITSKKAYVHAQNFQFEPISASISKGATIEIKVNIDTGPENIVSADAYVLYDSNILTIDNIQEGSFFPTVTTNTTQAGKAQISASVGEFSNAKTGSGTIATIIFKADSIGSVTLSFDCSQGLTTDSNIIKNDVNGTDVIICKDNGTASVTIIESGVSPTVPAATPTSAVPTPTISISSSTPTPVSIGGLEDTPQPTVSVLPRSGITDNILHFSIFGISLVVIGLGIIFIIV